MDTRKHDREDLGIQKDHAETTSMREKLDKTIHAINRKEEKIEALRENLIKAVRGNDHRARKYYENEILKQRG